jgi:hypothetical protein
VVAAALREVPERRGIHSEQTYLHAARRLPAAEYLQWRRHASSTVSGFDPTAGERLLRHEELMLAAVQMQRHARGNCSPEW